MAGAQKRSLTFHENMPNCPKWNVKKIYDTPSPDHMDSAGFFSAFASFHDINGNRVECILTKPKYQRSSVNISGNQEGSGLTLCEAVLVVRLCEMSGMCQGESLKVDGRLYVIQALSYPLEGVARMELAGVIS